MLNVVKWFQIQRIHLSAFRRSRTLSREVAGGFSPSLLALRGDGWSPGRGEGDGKRGKQKIWKIFSSLLSLFFGFGHTFRTVLKKECDEFFPLHYSPSSLSDDATFRSIFRVMKRRVVKKKIHHSPLHHYQKLFFPSFDSDE